MPGSVPIVQAGPPCRPLGVDMRASARASSAPMHAALPPSVPRGGRRILLVRLGAVGDVVRTLPLLHALREAMPDAYLGWAVEEASAPLLKEMAALDAVHVLARREMSRALLRPLRLPSALLSLRRFARDLREARYEAVLDVHGTFKAALACSLADAPVTGFGPGGSKELAHLLHDVSIPYPATTMTRVRRALFLGAASGMLGEFPEVGEHRAHFGLSFDAERVASIRQALGADPRPPVVLFPFASAAGQAKRWPLARHVELGTLLVERGERVVLAWGSAREREEASAALGRARPGRSGDIELAPRTDLVELTELLRGSALLVTGDTGPMHLAAGVGTPVVALFGASDPVINRPWGHPGQLGHAVIVREPLSALGVEEVLPSVLERLPRR